MSAFGAPIFRGGSRIALIALSTTLLASCAATSDAPFSFDLSSIGQEDGSSVSPDMAFVFDENDPLLPDTVAEQPQMRQSGETLAGIDANDGEQAYGAAENAEESAQEVQTAMSEPQTAPQEDAQTSGGFLSAFFSSSNETTAAAQAVQSVETAEQAVEPDETPETVQQTVSDADESTGIAAETSSQPALITTSSTGPLIDERAVSALVPMDALPGVRGDSLFEITRSSGMDDDDSDIDLYEGAGSYQVASAAGLARLAPNGLLKQHGNVDTACLKPALVRKLKTIERHFGERVIITSGYRSPEHNRRVRGARNSYHMACAAADIQVPGVSKQEIARFARALPGRGGVGTYCHTKSVHVDVGPERDWNWRCSRRR